MTVTLFYDELARLIVNLHRPTRLNWIGLLLNLREQQTPETDIEKWSKTRDYALSILLYFEK